jgi:hypothetical protein
MNSTCAHNLGHWPTAQATSVKMKNVTGPKKQSTNKVNDPAMINLFVKSSHNITIILIITYSMSAVAAGGADRR